VGRTVAVTELAGMGVARNTVSREVRCCRVDVIRLGGQCATRI
jgi:hypothetical protein